MKRRDPTIEEIHFFREEFAKAHEFDMHRMIETLKKQQTAGGRKTVSFSPRLIKRIKRVS